MPSESVPAATSFGSIPEQLRGAATDARSDIFSFGIVLYEMAAGRRPFDRDSTVSTITAILFEDPEPIEDEEVAPLVPIIRKALQKEPAKRYATSALLLEALEHAKARPRSRSRRPRTEEMAAARMAQPPPPPTEKVPSNVARRYEEAAARYRAVLDTETKFVPGHYYLGMALEMLGDYDGAIEHFRRSVEIAGPITLYLGALAHAYARDDRPSDAERVIQQLHELGRQRYTSPYNLAVAYMGQGRNDEALTALEAALHEHNAWIWFVPIDPRFDRLREDERFAPLMARFGLPAKVEADG